MTLKAPFPWFGGKSKVAPLVWDRFGIVQNYVEPFAGSLAVLLGRPSEPGTETVNDLDCYLSNFWRALSSDPEGITAAADWPVNEADVHARHLWLVNQTEFRERMKTDPDYFDSKIAGWWVWGISQWIGSGWCSRPEWTGRVNAGRKNRGMNQQSRHFITDKNWNARPTLSSAGEGVHRKIPNMGDDGRGVHRSEIAAIHGDHASENLYSYMCALSSRLRRVRVCCGDWLRVLGPSVTVKHSVSGIFLDPPYDMRVVSGAESGRDGAAPADGLYSNHDNDLSRDVRNWALANGDNPLLRIALCGYEGEHDFPRSWECLPWKAHGGYGSQRGDRGYENAARERIWFSPHCVRTLRLFSEEESL